MNVDEEEKYPFLKEEKAFIKELLKKETPLLGICLGGQLLARVCKAEVKKAPYEEIGYFKINLTEEGQNDPLFKGCETSFEVFQWHEDTFDIPKESILLATSKDFYQAFKIGKNAYGLQFHIEVTPQMIELWIDEYLNKEEKEKMRKIIIESYEKKGSFLRRAKKILNNFYQIMMEA
jgi:GMP synthase-like glutamine amidotransferase